LLFLVLDLEFKQILRCQVGVGLLSLLCHCLVVGVLVVTRVLAVTTADSIGIGLVGQNRDPVLVVGIIGLFFLGKYILDVGNASLQKIGFRLVLLLVLLRH
jgi:hypothetical protein